ncbi:hypothetical protein C494_04560 [Natronorubrum bangense JCM 10635]|nr:hypothetical protein C494_04560 [Natronorubrum bangense JCM 10635]
MMINIAIQEFHEKESDLSPEEVIEKIHEEHPGALEFDPNVIKHLIKDLGQE